MQKISKINWVILIFTNLLEIILLNIVLVTFMDISIYNELYNLVKVNVGCLGVDLVFSFYFLDYALNKKEPKNILKMGSYDVNYRMVKSFFIMEILKMILVIFSLNKTIGTYESRPKYLFILFIGMIIVYYVMYFLLPKKENLAKKIRMLKKKNRNLKFILIEGDIPSSFSLNENSSYQKNKNHLYININTEISRIKNKQIKDFIKENTIAVIHEIDSINDEVILKKYESSPVEHVNMFHVMAVKNKQKVNLDKQIKSLNTIKICDKCSVIEFVENLFAISEKEKISNIKYFLAKIRLKLVQEDKLKNDENKKEKYIENLNTIYQYNFNHRFNQKQEKIPKDHDLFELYRNSYLHTSAYQATFALFTYITVMGKMVEYYLYAKNNKNFAKEKIDKIIIGDNPSVWNNQILMNIYKNEQDFLYKNLRERKIKLTLDEKTLLHVYLSYLLNQDIKGEEISFDGLADLFIKFRNKVEAHGIISDANVYAVWNLTQFFATIYNQMFEVSKLECSVDKMSGEMKIGYHKDEKIGVGKYIILIDSGMYFIKEKDLYINYLTTDIESTIKEKKTS